MNELDYIQWLRKRTSASSRVILGPGDDSAAVEWSSGRPCLVTTDMLMDGTDFILADVEPRSVGRKAMAANLSDIAAMAGKPVAAVVAVALPKHGGKSLAHQLDLGLREMADAFDTALVGGDTNTWDGPLVISVTVVGEAVGRGIVTRAGAKAGDWLLTTGSFGGSILGRHLNFTPRVREALRLNELVDLHAMIDVSDGLSADVYHLCEESHCGAILFAESIPTSDAAHSLADGRTALEHALSDGEDFELAFAVAPVDGARLLRDQPLGDVRLTKVGEFVADGFWIEDAGVRRGLMPRGWVHTMES